MAQQGLSSSRTGTLYFGYGSNLSPYQMVGRCPSSGTPVAVAKLNSWMWIISERGYANLIPVRPTKLSNDTDASTIWGVVYNLTPDDEDALDRNEGWSMRKSGKANEVIEQRPWKPFEQGTATYNKLYMPVKIEKWLIDNPVTTIGISKTEYMSSIVRTLVYVDEYAVRPGRITQSYTRRMGRAARECIPLGVPERWINNVFSQYGIDKDDPNSFTNDILPGTDASWPAVSQWETIRQQYLLEGPNQNNEEKPDVGLA